MNIDNPYEITHYDEIPDHVFRENISILDIGCGDGYGAYHSRHKEHFLHNEYLGVDIQVFDFQYLEQIVSYDFLKFESEKTFDLIIFSHILEHFAVEHWPEIFEKLHGLLSLSGFLVVNVPYKEKENVQHLVLHIDASFLKRYFPFQKFIKCYNPDYDRVYFRSNGESLIKATLRFIYRIFTHHKYSVLRTFIKKPVRLVAIYQKKE